MAEEVIIQVTTETDAAQLEELDSLVEEIREKATIDASVEVEDTSLDEASDKATTLEDELTNIDNTVVSPQVDTSGLDEASGKAEETASSIDNITTAAAGIAATAGIEQMITTADNINNSWNRLELTFAGTGVSMDTLKSKASELSNVTGRSGGTVRDYFNQMGIAGVDNANLLSSSFEALSGKAYQTNQSIESMEGRLQRMVMTGNASGMSLQRLGIDAEDLANAMGVSAEEVSEAFKNMTPEERLQAITKAMGEGKEANEMYKNSYAGLKDRADAAMAGLAGAVGQAILPIVIPALEAATQFIKMLSDGFKSLPGPVQGAIGAVLGVAAIGTTLIGTLGMVGKVIGTVKTGLETIGMLGKVTSVLSSIGGAFSSLWGIIIANPIILLVVAVVALIAALIWAYYNVDWFREMVDNAWASIVQFATFIYDTVIGALTGLGEGFTQVSDIIVNSFVNAVNWVMTALQNLWNYIVTLGGLLPANVQITGNSIVDTVIRVMAFIATLPFQLAMIFTNMIASALGFGDNFVQTMINGAADAVNGFISWISQLPGKLAEELNAMLQMAAQFVMDIANMLTGGAAGMVIGWITGSGEQSPGYMYDAFAGELDAMENRAKNLNLPNTLKNTSKNMVDSFNPELGGTANARIGSGQVNNFYFSDIVVDNDDRMQRIVDYVAKSINWNNTTAGRSEDL